MKEFGARKKTGERSEQGVFVFKERTVSRTTPWSYQTRNSKLPGQETPKMQHFQKMFGMKMFWRLKRLVSARTVASASNYKQIKNPIMLIFQRIFSSPLSSLVRLGFASRLITPRCRSGNCSFFENKDSLFRPFTRFFPSSKLLHTRKLRPFEVEVTRV